MGGYTADSRVVGLDRQDLTHDQVTAILRAAGSPAANEAHAIYSWMCAAPLVSAAYLLACFNHESRMGTDPSSVDARYGTRNPGNCRSSRIGKGTVIQTDRGPFVQYNTWADGFQDMAFRLSDPSYDYAQAHAVTPAQIIPISAPKSDGNDPAAYIAAVVADMNRYVNFAESEGGAMPDLWYPAATRHAAACFTVGAQANPARVYPSGVDMVVMHHTDGSAAGTIQWFANPASQVSAHFLVARDGSVHQFVSLADVAWHAGDWPVNVRSVGIEHEQAEILDASGKPTGQWQDWPQGQLQASADLLTWLKARLGGWTVKRHREVSDNPTSCPGDLPVETIVGLMGTPAPVPSAPQPAAADVRTLNGHTLTGGFRAYYEKIEAALGADEALMLLGLPLTDETQENGITVQYFERAVFEWHPGSRPADFDVLLRRLGADALAAKTSS